MSRLESCSTHQIFIFSYRNLQETMMLAKLILSKLDFQSFSLIDRSSSWPEERELEVKTLIESELKTYLNELQQMPTIMRKTAANSKSETFRLFKLENFQSFENVKHRTDRILGISLID